MIPPEMIDVVLDDICGPKQRAVWTNTVGATYQYLRGSLDTSAVFLYCPKNSLVCRIVYRAAASSFEFREWPKRNLADPNFHDLLRADIEEAIDLWKLETCS